MGNTTTPAAGPAIGLNDLNEQLGRQTAAIGRQVDDLEALASPLRNKFDRSPGESAQLAQLMVSENDLRNQQNSLRAAYLQNVASILDIPALVAKLEQISSQMEAEASKMEDITHALTTATTIITFGNSAISEIKKAASG
jgi:hypothetical protein